MMMHGFIVAGTNSGCGKTTISIGLMALLKSMGYKVAPFKTGPDYIDPAFHHSVLGVPSYNLDSFMLPHLTLKHLFAEHTEKADIAIVEGVMGMYDGMGEKATGSSYELGRILSLPVILVVNCKGLYQSVAAIVKGFSELKPDANVCGVILNHVPNYEYYSFLKKIIEDEGKIACLGYLPTNKDLMLESRHLGLIQAEEVGELSNKVEKLRETLAHTIDIKALLGTTALKAIEPELFELPKIDLSGLNIGIAYDKAFRFYYKDNLELLEELGASLSYFSPINDRNLPEKCNCLYIGGGYPEVFAKELLANKKMLEQIKNAADKGFPVYAECGGLMYLSEKIINLNGSNFEMAGVFNVKVQMTKHLKRFGYALVNYHRAQSKSHEFHRSEIVEPETSPNYKLEFQLKKPEKQREWQCGLRKKNTLAGYAHIHFYSNFQFFEQIVELWKKAIM